MTDDNESQLALSFLCLNVDRIYSILDSIPSSVLTQFSDEAALSGW